MQILDAYWLKFELKFQKKSIIDSFDVMSRLWSYCLQGLCLLSFALPAQTMEANIPTPGDEEKIAISETH